MIKRTWQKSRHVPLSPVAWNVTYPNMHHQLSKCLTKISPNTTTRKYRLFFVVFSCHHCAIYFFFSFLFNHSTIPELGPYV